MSAYDPNHWLLMPARIIGEVAEFVDISYAEVVTAVSAVSVDESMRRKIDDFVEAGARTLQRVGGAKMGKSIIVINPAHPALPRRDTVLCELSGEFKWEQVKESVVSAAAKLSKGESALALKSEPQISGRIVTVFLEELPA